MRLVNQNRNTEESQKYTEIVPVSKDLPFYKFVGT